MTTNEEIAAIRKRIIERNPNFLSLEQIQEHIRVKGTPDYLVLNGDIFTMQEYDMDGKEISYACKKSMIQLTVTTQNRYDKNIKFSDAILTKDTLDYLRDDIEIFE